MNQADGIGQHPPLQEKIDLVGMVQKALKILIIDDNPEDRQRPQR